MTPASEQSSAGSPQDEMRARNGAQALLRRDDFDRDVISLMGLPVDLVTLDETLASIDMAVRTGRRLSFLTPNLNWFVRGLGDDEARRQAIEADLSVADGAPLLWLARLIGVRIPGRVAGSDLFEAMRRRASFAGRPIRVFFFGGEEGAGEAAARVIDQDRGGVVAAGWLNPGFGDVDQMSAPSVIDEINRAKPDFVFVALGAAKGQTWISRNLDALDAPVIAHLGATVNFTAGAIARAPRLLRRLGLEWAWRIKEEPALWRRYAGDAIGLALALPSRALRAWRGPGLGSGRQAQTPGQVILSQTGEATIIRLSGDFLRARLDKVRAAFRQAAAAGKDVELDFSAIGRFDPSFLGLILMLEKHVAAHKREIRLSGANRRQLAVLRANDMRYRMIPKAAMRDAGAGADIQAARG